MKRFQELAVKLGSSARTAGLAASLLTVAVAPAMAQEDCLSRGFSASEAQVIDAYIAFYGRAPDVGGLEFWSGRLEDEGGDLSSIIQAFGESREYDDRFGALSDRDLINNLYQQLFGRDADPGGLAFYEGELSSGNRTLQSIATPIPSSRTRCIPRPSANHW